MRKIIHFPLSSEIFSHQFGIKALDKNSSITIRTDEYEKEVQLKKDLLEDDPQYYSFSAPQSSDAEREASSLLTSKSTCLKETAKSVQEDLVILSGNAALGHPIIAGVVCFPNGWTIRDKAGLGIDKVHDPVPEYAEVMSQAVNKLLTNLKPGRSFWRSNWAIRPSKRLDQSPKMKAQVDKEQSELNPENVSRKCYFRVEYQTLTRLETSRDILFTILTDQLPVIALEQWQQSNLLGVLKTCPRETIQYKAISPFYDLLCNDLEKRLD